MVFKQLLQAEAIDVVQIDSCRLAGVSEVLSVLFMAAKSGPVFSTSMFFSDLHGVLLGLVYPYARMQGVLAYASMSFI